MYIVCLHLFTYIYNCTPYYKYGLVSWVVPWAVVVWIIQGGRGVWVVSWVCSVAYMQPTTQAGTRKAPQCGGALACESKLQGKFAGCDCSNYQLFRCSSWDGFFRMAFQLSL